VYQFQNNLDIHVKVTNCDLPQRCDKGRANALFNGMANRSKCAVPLPGRIP
jgi:hypothetical protein